MHDWMHPVLWILALVVVLAATLVVEAVTDSTVAAVAVFVVLAAIGLARSLYVGDLNRMRRR